MLSMLNFLQVRLQTQSRNGLKRSMVQMFAHVAKCDGLMGLYRGVCLQFKLITYLRYTYMNSVFTAFCILSASIDV